MRRLILALVVFATTLTPATSASQALGTGPESIDDITLASDFHEPHADILRLYFAILDRQPDVGGARYWIDRYNNGDTVVSIARHMSASPEFVERYGDTTVGSYVAALYRNVLDREPDGDGYEFWVGGVESGDFSRLWVLRHFAASSEFVADHRFRGEDDARPGPPLTRPVGTGGPVVTVSVDIEPVLGWDVEQAEAEIVAILGDIRGWTAAGTVRFQLLVGDARRDADVRVRIATPGTVDARCRPLRTGGRLSCRNGDSLHLNSDRWAGATSFWTASLAEYRAYLINHEMGHFLGYGHRKCPGRGELAPVMQQQTKSLQGCLANGWPYPN